MNKKYFGITTLILAMILVVPVMASTAVPSAQVLKLTLMNQDPDPVEPGNYVELRWQVISGSYDDAVDVTFEIQPKYPFSLPSGVSALKTFPVIKSNTQDDDVAVLYYKLRVADDAVQGTEQIRLRYKMGNEDWRYTQTDYDVRIKTYDSYISVEEIESNPEVISPGESAEVTLKLKNVGDTTVSDVKVLLDLDNDKLPISPLDSSNEKMITTLKQYSTGVVKFRLGVDPEATAGLYKIPLKLSFNDLNGDSFTSEKVFSLIIGAKPELGVVLDETTITTAGTKGTATIKFVNKGLTDIKFLDMQIGNSEAFDLLSTSEVYIGNVDSDDYESTDIELYINPTEETSVKVPISYQYRDANNKEYHHDTELNLRVYTSDELEQYGLTGEKNNSKYIIILIVLLVGFFIWRRYKKRKNNQK